MVLNLPARSFWCLLCILVAGGCLWTTGVQADEVDPFIAFRLKTRDGRYLSAFRYTPNVALVQLVTSLSSMQAEDFTYDPCSLNLKSLTEQLPVTLIKPLALENEEQTFTELQCNAKNQCKLWVRFGVTKSKPYLVTYKKSSMLLIVTDVESNGGCNDYEFTLEKVTNGMRNPPRREMKWVYENSSICFLPDIPPAYQAWGRYYNINIKLTEFKLCMPVSQFWTSRKNMMIKNGMATDSRIYVLPTKSVNQNFMSKFKRMVESSFVDKDVAQKDINFGKILFSSELGQDTLFQVASVNHDEIQLFLQKQKFPEGFKSFQTINFAYPKLLVDRATRVFLDSTNMNQNSRSPSPPSDPRSILDDEHFRAMLSRGEFPGRHTVSSLHMHTPADVYFVGNGLNPNFRTLRPLENADVFEGFTHLYSGDKGPIPKIPAYKFAKLQGSLGTYAAAELLRLAPHATLIPINLGAHYDAGDVFKAIETIVKYAEVSNRASVVYLPLYTSRWEEEDKGLIVFSRYLKTVIQRYPKIAFVLGLRETHVVTMGRLLHKVAMLASSTNTSAPYQDLVPLTFHLYSTPAIFSNKLLLVGAPSGKKSVTECVNALVHGAKVAGTVVHGLTTSHFFNQSTLATDLFRFSIDTAYRRKDYLLLAHALSHPCPSAKGPFRFTWDPNRRVYDCHLSSDKSGTFVDEPETVTEAEKEGNKVWINKGEDDDTDETKLIKVEL